MIRKSQSECICGKKPTWIGLFHLKDNRIISALLECPTGSLLSFFLLNMDGGLHWSLTTSTNLDMWDFARGRFCVDFNCRGGWRWEPCCRIGFAANTLSKIKIKKVLLQSWEFIQIINIYTDGLWWVIPFILGSGRWSG